MHPISVGTCGWSYPDWIAGGFYPKGLPPGQFLSYYAERFNIVEVDSSFYASPRPQMVQGWHDRTPKGFRFCLKVPQTITHEKLLQNCAEEVELFLSAARVLQEKLFCCVLQFSYLNAKTCKDLTAFLSRLDPFLATWPKDVQLAVEIRNKNWFVPQFADALRKHNAAWVTADQAWTPAPLSLAKKMDVVTGPFAYLRLLGDRKEVDDLTSTLDHTVIDRTEQIRLDAQAMRLLSQRVPVLAFVNNHFAGYAHDTIRILLEELGESYPSGVGEFPLLAE